MIGCLRTRVRKQPIIALYFESENEVKFYNLEAWFVVTRSDAIAWLYPAELIVVCYQGEEDDEGK